MTTPTPAALTTQRELLLLGLLRQQAMHAYRLNEVIDQLLATCTDLKKPTVYFLLDKMKKTGWITERRAQSGKRPSRRIFSLTAAGEVQFQQFLRANLSAWLPAYFPGDIGLAYVDTLPAAEAHALLLARRTALETALAAAQAAPDHGGSLQWVIEHQVHHLSAELDWLDSRLAKLSAGRPRRKPARAPRPKA